MNKLLSICFVLLLGVNQIVAQDIQVNGTVLGIDNQEPVIGATVLVVGSKTGTVTDMDGKFSLKVPADATLQVSFIGMRMEKVKAKPEMIIYLHPDSELLEEVVVTGYGNVSKSSYTGAASILSTEKQRDLPVISVTQMMEANLPGVSMSSASGTPGSNTSIRIRGIGSISGSNEPLYVLDGVPVQSGNMSPNDMNTGGLGILNTLNPADIENITILKDAASSSLYGARGANGVVLITTKKGKEGKTTYNVKASFGISDLAYQFRPTMGGDERRELIWEGLRNSMVDMGSSMEEASRYADSQIDVYAPKPANGYADWEDALFRKAQQQNYDFSLRGGSENTRFAGSVNYTKQDNVAYNSGFERYSGHLNFNNKFKKFDVGMNALFSLTKEKPLPGGTYYSNPMYALKTALNPSIPIYNEDGSYNTDITSINNMNPVYENEINQHKSQVARTFASIEAGYTNVDYTHTKDFRYFSPESSDGKSPNGQGDIYSIENLTYNSNTRLNYTHTFGDHSIDVLAAYEIQRWDREYMEGEAKNYSTGKKNVLDNASTPVYIGHNVSGDAMLSYVLRANYDYKKKYYVSVSFRRDGSSRLDPSNRWDNFWAVSASWRLSQEKFMKPLESWLSDAKLRVSYGVNGNIPGNLYDYYGLYDMSYSYNDQPAMVESNLANPELSWEKNYALNVGADFFLFGRLNLSVDWYVRNTKDLLLSRSVNPVTGFSSITDNIGKMRNKGVEIELSSTNIDRNKNEVIKLADVSEYYTDSYYIVKEGYSLGTIALREYAGVDPENGKPMYYSNVLVDGERSREIVYDPNEAVSVPLANIYPKVSGGLTNTFRYKMFDLSFNLSYSLGGHSYDSGMWAIQDDGYSSYAPKSVELRRRWQKPGDITDVPRYVNGQEFGGYWHSSRGIHSTDHLRLKSLILGVNAPRKWLNPVGLSMARIYFSGTNLLTWAKYDQYDPELQGTVGFDIPPLKTFSVGLEVEF